MELIIGPHHILCICVTTIVNTVTLQMSHYAKLGLGLNHIVCHIYSPSCIDSTHIKCRVDARRFTAVSVSPMLSISQNSSMMVPQREDKWKKGSDDQKSQFNR